MDYASKSQALKSIIKDKQKHVKRVQATETRPKKARNAAELESFEFKGAGRKKLDNN